MPQHIYFFRHHTCIFYVCNMGETHGTVGQSQNLSLARKLREYADLLSQVWWVGDALVKQKGAKHAPGSIWGAALTSCWEPITGFSRLFLGTRFEGTHLRSVAKRRPKKPHVREERQERERGNKESTAVRYSHAGRGKHTHTKPTSRAAAVLATDL